MDISLPEISRTLASVTCLSCDVKLINVKLTGSRTEFKIDGELLPSSHDQAIGAVQVRTVGSVVESTCEVQSADVKG